MVDKLFQIFIEKVQHMSRFSQIRNRSKNWARLDLVEDRHFHVISRIGQLCFHGQVTRI